MSIAGALVVSAVGLPSLIVLAGFQSAPPDPPVQLPPAARSNPGRGLSGQPWQWQSTQHADGSSSLAAEPSRYTIAFQSDGSLAIRADCNSVLGTYSVSDTDLSITLGPSTLVACPPDSQADQFLADLSQASNYTLVQNDLQLGLQPGGQMVLAPHPLPDLVGPTWQLNAYNNGRGGVQSILDGSQITAEFRSDGRVSGSAGCNRYMGSFQATETGGLMIGPLATTRMLCAQPVMDQETAYLSALAATTQYRFENDELIFRDGTGATQAVFTQ